jgi:serine/threonine protein kinase
MVLGTIRPESTFLHDDGVELMARGERLWLMPRPQTTKVGTVPPWPPGYCAPELVRSLPVVANPQPSVDVFSVGVMFAELLLGAFPFARTSFVSLISAQLHGAHAPLPSTQLGRLLTRAIVPSAEARPSVEEMDAELSLVASDTGAA